MAGKLLCIAIGDSLKLLAASQHYVVPCLVSYTNAQCSSKMETFVESHDFEKLSLDIAPSLKILVHFYS